MYYNETNGVCVKDASANMPNFHLSDFPQLEKMKDTTERSIRYRCDGYIPARCSIATKAVVMEHNECGFSHGYCPMHTKVFNAACASFAKFSIF